MVLPASLAQRFSPNLARALRLGSVSEAGAVGAAPAGISLGALDSGLPDAGFARGGVVELSLSEGAPGTSLALAACRAVQEHAERVGSPALWCAFVDPSASLHAVGVAKSGVRLDRLLVVRPSLSELPRSVLRLAKSAAFELLIVDLVGVLGAGVRAPLNTWPRLVRRLALEVDGTERSVLLLTEATAQRSLPLPVLQRIEVKRPTLERLVVQVAKDRRGFVTSPRSIAWTRPSEEGESSEEGGRKSIHARAG